MRAQQDPVEPPFVVPQWFVDRNITTATDDHPPQTSISFADDSVDYPEADSEGSYGGDSVDRAPPNPEEVDAAKHAEISGVQNDQSISVDEDGTTAESRPRYRVGREQWDEVSTTVRGLLRSTTANPHIQLEPAVRANNLIIHYAGRDGQYLLDALVKKLASENHSHLLELDVQDIADLASQARARDPSAAQARMLSYDMLSTPETEVSKIGKPEMDETSEMEDDEEVEDWSMEAPSFEMPFPSGGRKPTTAFGKPFIVELGNIGNLFRNRGSQAGSRSNDLSSMFSDSASRLSNFNQSPRSLGLPAGPFTNLSESLLTAVSEKCHHPRESNDTDTAQHDSPASAEFPRTTIIHIKDVKAIQSTMVGPQFLNDLYIAIEARRNRGEHLVIVGTECEKERVEVTYNNLDTIQRTPLFAELSRTIAISPILHSSELTDNLLEDRLRRIASINLRHIWEMMRVWEKTDSATAAPFLGLQPGFWKTKDKDDFYETLAHNDKKRLSRSVWSFQYIHRLVSYIRGLNDYAEFVKTNRCEVEYGKRLPLITAVASKMAENDAGKVAMSNKSIYKSSSAAQRKSKKNVTTVEQVKISQVQRLASKHEKRLLGGVVEPSRIKTTFDDVHAPAETIEALQTLTTLSLINPEAFSYGVLASDRIPGLLLYGPPGTGKTLLAKAVAKESGATMLEVSAADLNDMYVGEGEKNVRALFSLAKKLSPCVVFLDEADAMFSARSAAGRRVSHRELLNQFLKEWDGMSNDAGSAFLMVATNRPMDFDDAVLRRLPRRLLIDLPTQKDRHEILKIHLKAEQLAEDLDLADLAKRTPFYSGSDLKNLCVAAALTAVREQSAVPLRSRPRTDAANSNTDAVPSSDGSPIEKDLTTIPIPTPPNGDSSVNTATTAPKVATPTSMLNTVDSPSQDTAHSDERPAAAHPQATDDLAAHINRIHNSNTSFMNLFKSSEPSTSYDSSTSTSANEQKGIKKRRVLTKQHFDKALEEITASISEDMNSLKEIKKFDEVYGDRKGKRKGRAGLGFSDGKQEKGGKDGWGVGRDTERVRS